MIGKPRYLNTYIANLHWRELHIWLMSHTQMKGLEANMALIVIGEVWVCFDIAENGDTIFEHIYQPNNE